MAVHGVPRPRLRTRARLRTVTAAGPLGVTIMLPGVTHAQDSDGFNGYVQNGTCDSPTDDVRVSLDGRGEHDVQPCEATSPLGKAVVLGYYGAPELPGFGLAAVYTDEDSSLVITDTAGGAAVACGDLLEPASDDFTKAGLALVELRPVGDNGDQGFAMVKRLGMQRELDVTPARVQVVLFAPPVGG